MDQAQIAREIARGNGFTTKLIRPVAYYQAEKAQKQHGLAASASRTPITRRSTR